MLEFETVDPMRTGAEGPRVQKGPMKAEAGFSAPCVSFWHGSECRAFRHRRLRVSNPKSHPDDCIFIMNGRVMATGWMAVQMKHQVEAIWAGVGLVAACFET